MQHGCLVSPIKLWENASLPTSHRGPAVALNSTAAGIWGCQKQASVASYCFLLQAQQQASPYLADSGTGGATSGVTSASVSACEGGACCSNARAAEAVVSACIWRLLQSNEPCVGSLEHLSWAFLPCLVCCLTELLLSCKHIGSSLHRPHSDHVRSAVVCISAQFYLQGWKLTG